MHSLTNEDLLVAGLLTVSPKHKQPPPPPPPTVSSAKGVNFSATEGSTFAGTVAMFNDNDVPCACSATITWGDTNTSPGTIMYANGTDGGEAYIVTGSHVYQEEGSYQVSVMITDTEGTVTASPSTATVADAALLVTGASPIVGTEGTALNSVAVATFTDPGGHEDPMGEYSASIDWGDNNTTTGSITYDAPSQTFTVSGSHTYAEEGSYTVTTTVHHDTSDSAPPVSVTTSADISDAALSTPSVTPITATEGQSYTSTIATFTDPSGPEALADYSSFVIWGDGTSGPGTISVAGSTFSVAGPHTYAEEGSYPVSVTITHDSAGSVVATTTATVSDAVKMVSVHFFRPISGTLLRKWRKWRKWCQFIFRGK
jgi:hypothetical protein